MRVIVNNHRKFLFGFVMVTLLSFLFSFVHIRPAMAIPDNEMRTVFLIGHISDPESSVDFVPLQAYIVYGDQLILAETWEVPTRELGAVGLAVDQENEYLFMSFEQDDKIDVFSVKDASYIDRIRLAQTDNLCGMVVHQERGHLFVVDRGKPDIFVFDTNNNFELTEHWLLPTGEGAWGIDLLGDLLFVTDVNTAWSNDVRWYDIDTHQEAGHITLPEKATAVVAMEDKDNPENGPLLFFTMYDGSVECGLGPCDLLQKYSVGSANTDTIVIGKSGKGITANPAQNLIYVAQGTTAAFADAKVKVLDASNLDLLNEYPLETSWKPTDIVASSIPFGGSISKTCITHPDGKIRMGQPVTFRIRIMNRSDQPLTFVPLQDIYDTSQLTYVSADPAPDDPANDGQLDWSDLTVSFGMDLSPSETFLVDVQFQAIEPCSGILDGSNLAKVEGAMDTQGRPLFVAGVFDYGIECSEIPDDDDDDDPDPEDDDDDDDDDNELWPEGKVTGGCCSC